MTVQEALNQSAQELQQQLEEHRRLLVRAIEGDAGGIEIENCLLLACPHKRTLKGVLGVLEETRKAFKSKRLEVLRKKLIRVLAENA
ncbi:MAG: hypothetical protein JRI58_07570 [Deltaproteobacteria bacterium]|nr:hypothetical protein [Deltaproteobacteria bacterium]